MSEAMRQTLKIAGISMATIFGVMTLLYGAIKLMVREGNGRPDNRKPGVSA